MLFGLLEELEKFQPVICKVGPPPMSLIACKIQWRLIEALAG